MSEITASDALIRNERVLAFPAAAVFAAFADGNRLAQWWGPAGFTNTFEVFEFQPGGRWVHVMHGPNGADYPNESIFREIVADQRLVLNHISAPKYTLTVTLTPQGGHTHLRWDQEFESPELAAKMRQICEPANEQNLDRLQAVLES